MNPFDFVKSINATKKNLITDSTTEKAYSPFIINRSLSYFIDTVLYANEINQYSHLDNKLQYDYLLHSIPKRSRFSKWYKPEKDEDLEVVAEFFKCNFRHASEILKIINKSDIDLIKQKLQKGGVKEHERG